MPQTLSDIGGFLNDSFSDWFQEYAEFAYRTFDSKVRGHSAERVADLCLGHSFGIREQQLLAVWHFNNITKSTCWDDPSFNTNTSGYQMVHIMAKKTAS